MEGVQQVTVFPLYRTIFLTPWESLFLEHAERIATITNLRFSGLTVVSTPLLNVVPKICYQISAHSSHNTGLAGTVSVSLISIKYKVFVAIVANNRY